MTANDSASSGRISPFEAIKHVDEDDEDASAYRPYVYTLAYPDGRVFYVGKGVKDRILDHEVEAKRGVKSAKCDIIREIWARGGGVVKRKVAFFQTDEEAMKYEHYLISTLDGLANISPGSGEFEAVVISPEDQRQFGISIRRFTEDGQAYWSARELAAFLGYASWQSFSRLIAKVEAAFTKAGVTDAEDFRHTTLSVLTGYDTRRDIEDVHLSPIGFLLVLQNADPAKAMVAYGKNYIARQALRADLPPQPGRRDRIVLEDPPTGNIHLTHRHRLRLRQPSDTVRAASDAAQNIQYLEREQAQLLRIEQEDRLGLFAQLMAPESDGTDEQDS